jgi:hypothetical protein
MFAGIAVQVAVRANAVQQCLMPLERSTILPANCLRLSQAVVLEMPSAWVIRVIGFPFVSREPHRLELTLLRRGHLDLCMISVLLLLTYILNFQYYTKLGQPHGFLVQIGA